VRGFKSGTDRSRNEVRHSAPRMRFGFCWEDYYKLTAFAHSICLLVQSNGQRDLLILISPLYSMNPTFLSRTDYSYSQPE
jgi:hypothetical protein